MNHPKTPLSSLLGKLDDIDYSKKFEVEDLFNTDLNFRYITNRAEKKTIEDPRCISYMDFGYSLKDEPLLILSKSAILELISPLENSDNFDTLSDVLEENEYMVESKEKRDIVINRLIRDNKELREIVDKNTSGVFDTSKIKEMEYYTILNLNESIRHVNELLSKENESLKYELSKPTHVKFYQWLKRGTKC